MKKQITLYFTHLLLLSLLLPVANPAFAQGTAFSYQGHLLANGAAANGNYDLKFAVFDADVGAAQHGPDVALNNVPVANGQFNVALDFGPAVFTGGARWLEISVRPAGVGEYTKMDARLALLPTPYAMFAATAGSVADGSITSSHLAPAAIDPTKLRAANGPERGRVLSYDGEGFDWVAPSAASVWALNGTSAYYTGGNVGIGTATPTPGISLEVNGAALLTPGGSGGTIQFGTPSAETGMTIKGANRADVRFDGSTLKLVAGTGGGAPSSANGIAITTEGYVSIGTATPTPGIRLEVNGAALLTPGGSGGSIQFGTPSAETGMTIKGDNRADVRFDGSTLKLVAGTGGGVPSSANGIAITTSGNVGIGTTTPGAKLDVEISQLGIAVYGNQTSTSGGTGVYGGGTASGYGVFANNPNGRAIYANGDAAQARDKGGFVKAMVYVDANGTITRCYNGLTRTTDKACGFTIEKLDFTGLWRIDFGFRVDDRFASVTPGLAEQYHADGNYTEYKGPTGASVLYGYQPTFIGEAHPNSIFVQQSLPGKFESPYFYWAGFTLIVY